MRYSSIDARAIVTVVVVATGVVAWAAAASPALGQTAPSASAGASPGSSRSIPAGALIDSRVSVGVPVAPRWFAADGQSLWIHEPTGLVRLDLATSAITGQVPAFGTDYGYATTGEGAV